MEETKVSVGRACRVISLQRSGWYYLSTRDDAEMIAHLNDLAKKYPTRGFDTYYGMIRNRGLRWGRSRVLRVYRSMKLSLRRKHKRRLPKGVKSPLEKQILPNESYSIDFMSDALVSGRRLRILKVIDDCTRESLAVWCDYSIPYEKVVEVLDSVIANRGTPAQIRTDNGPEFRSKVFTCWCEKNKITIKYIQPGRPMQNAYIERFNRTFREDVLDAYLFEDLEEVRILSDEWQYHYNNHHPHGSLAGKPPAVYRREIEEKAHLKPLIERQLQHPDQQRTNNQKFEMSMTSSLKT